MNKEELHEYERLARALNDDALRNAYAKPFDEYRPCFVARVLGNILISSGSFLYGKKPSYAKFKAIEVIARIPYQSWEMATYTLLTCFYSNEQRALELARTQAFSRTAQDNETMHVVVISNLACAHDRQGFFRHTFIPLIFSFSYFLSVFVLYLFSRRAALDLNYMFESHAYEEYDTFLKAKEKTLRRRPIASEFLAFYGREVRNEYELIELIRNDELIHRNRSVREQHANL